MKTSTRSRSHGTPSHESLPVIEEQVRIGKRVEETGAVRVRIESEAVEQPCDIGTTHEEVEVEHVPVGRVVEARREPWTDGDAVVVPVYEEVLVPRLVLKEEIRLVRRRRTAHEAGTVSLRRDRAVVERRQPDGTWREVPSGAQPGDVPAADDGRRESQDPILSRSNPRQEP